MKSVQRLYYVLSCRLVLFTRQNRKIKALLGMLARLPWGRRDVSGSINGKYEGVSVKDASLIVSCQWIKVFITA